MKFQIREWRKLLLVLFAVILMGFNLSFINRTGWGMDPCSSMNMGIAHTIGWTFGNWQAFFNCILLVIVLVSDRSLFGFGALFNMFLVGYSVDFFTWAENKLLPDVPWESIAVKLAVGLPALAFFIISSSIYMTCDMGTAPYDALVFLLHRKLSDNGTRKPGFRLVRTLWDFTAVLIGFVLGGKPGIVTVLMALFLGTTIDYTAKIMRKTGIVKTPEIKTEENIPER